MSTMLFVATPLSAATCNDGSDGYQTNILPCNNSSDGGLENSDIWQVLILILNVMTGGVGIAAVGGIVFGAIMYASAGGSTEQTKKAITIITNVVIGIVAYALMYSLANFLIPGGLF